MSMAGRPGALAEGEGAGATSHSGWVRHLHNGGSAPKRTPPERNRFSLIPQEKGRRRTLRKLEDRLVTFPSPAGNVLRRSLRR